VPPPTAVDALPDAPAWSAALRRISEQPLELCPDFPRIAKRFEAWWAHGALDRPVFIATGNTTPARPITRRLELLETPDAWLEAKKTDLHQTHWVGDAVPAIRADFGPVMLGGLLGGQTQFLEDTTWTHAFINDDWSNAPAWNPGDNHPWLILLPRLLRMLAEDGAGRYLAMTPDLGGSADVLLNLRGSSGLCLDIVEQPQRIAAALDALYPLWRRVFTEFYRQTVPHGLGVIHWLGLWSDRPYMVPACDFNFMIGPDEFQRYCLPDIARQAATVGRAVFHLDGPGAARHIDALLEIPEIQAIQFTPGAGTPSAMPWVPMFRKIQSKGRSLLVIVEELDEVLPLCAALKPEGLAFLTGGQPEKLDAVFAALCREAGAAKSD
jgi:hypothetical protein